MNNASTTNLPSIHGTQLRGDDPHEVYRQKIARITLDSMVQFVGLLDAQGTVLEINKVALDAVGIELSEVAGRPFWTTFWWQVSAEINQTLRACIARAARGEFVRWDTPIYGRAGGKETIIIDASLMPVKDEHGRVLFIAAEGRDITEKTAYEREIARGRAELAKLDELKTEFFANISHEFRTQLTLMLGPLEDALAAPAALSAANRERLELAHRNALRQLKLVNTLLDFSGIEAGRTQASYQPPDLAQLTAEIASVWRSAIERTGIVEEALRWLPETHHSAQERPSTGARLLRYTQAGIEANVPLQRRGSRVLLVDDNADMREYVARLLGEGGHTVQMATDGVAALELARTSPPDLILTDVMMPRIDGFALLRELRSNAALGHIPVILLSARAGEESLIEGLEAGADDYLIKPFSARELLARVDSQLKKARFRRDATLALAENETRFRALVTASSDAVYRMSPDWTEMRHLEGREFVADTHEPSRSWLEKYIDPADQEHVLGRIRIAIRTKQPFEMEHRVRRLDGTLGWTFSRAIPLCGEHGDIVEWLGMASDITERKRFEESLRQADRRKDEFLATLAHELRNPLAPISNAVQLLRRVGVDDQKIRAARDIVERQVQHIVRLVDDLMEVSRITLGQITLRKEYISLRAVLAAALEAVTPAIEANRHALSVQLPAEALHVEGDATRLSQVFQNLLHNAAKYTPPGGRIALHSECIGTEVRVSVRDTGIGIAPELHPRVFELFTRVHPDHSLNTSGLGIGLALARQLVERHSGRLELRSEGAGTGSEFIVTLPLATQPPTSMRTLESNTVAPGLSRVRSVLVVDDNSDAGESLAMLLHLEGYSVCTVRNGAEALDVFDRMRPEVVLLDIGLPDIDGYEIARRIRLREGSKRTLLIALTGWGQSQDKERAAQAGFDEHLTKPVELELLRMLMTVDDFA